MATRKTKQTQTTQYPTDKARALWLAGLGAVSIAQKRGGALMSGLIAEGDDFQSRTQKLAEQVTAQTTAQVKDAIAPFRAGFKRNVQKFGAAVQHGIAGVLAKLGIPSKSDIEELTQRVAALSKQLKAAK
jgi:poly(hydroxyalkanoate) granule-associated protein